MKPKSTLRSLLFLAGSSLLVISYSHAADGTWDTDANGDWTTVTNWSGDAAYAFGQDSTATFGNVISDHRTINLNAPITIGNITTSDTDKNYTISGSNTLTLDRSDSTAPTISVSSVRNIRLTISSKITGSDGLIKTNAGVLTLGSTSNDFTGLVKVDGGKLEVSDNRHLGAIANAIEVTSGGQIALGGSTVNRNFTISGSGFVEAANGHTYGAIRLDGTTFGGTITLAADSRIASVTTATSNNTINAKITGSYGVEFFGIGNGANTTVNMTLSNTANDYTGNTTISSGYHSGTGVARANLLLGASNVIPNGAGKGNVVFALNLDNIGSTVGLDLNGKNETINGLTVNAGAFTSRITNSSTTASSTLTIGDNNTTSSFSGIIEDSNATNNLKITKIGTGSLTLSGASSSYRGATTIQAGSLVAGASSLVSTNGAFGNAASALVLGNGSTGASDAPAVLINGAFTVGRAITVGSLTNTAAYNATIGGSNTTGISTFSGNITLNTTATNYTVTLQAATGGTVDFTTGTWTANNKAIVIGSTGNTGTVRLSNAIATSGGISVNFGTLQLGSSDRLGDTTPVTVAGGILDVSTFTDTAGTLDVTGAATINLGVGAALAFADSKLVDWTGGTLNITGTLGATSLRFGNGLNQPGLDPAQLAVISVNGSGAGTYVLDSSGYLVSGGPDTTPPTLSSSNIVDDKSGGPVSVGTLVTYTVTFSEDMDASTVTAAAFEDGGTSNATIGSVTETSPTSGVFLVQATPTIVGNLILQVKSGATLNDAAAVPNALDTASAIADNTTIAVTVADPYAAWATGGELFDGDANGDGVDNGLAWLLGATGPNVSALNLLPKVSQSGGNLILDFTCLKVAGRGTAVLKLQHSKDLGISDAWTVDEVVVPDAAGVAGVTDVVTFTVPTTNADPDLVDLRATIPASAAAPGTKLFGRIKADQP